MAIVLGITSLAALVFLLRLLLNLQSRTDRFFTRKYPHLSRGFQWGMRIPYKVGEVLQFYFYCLMGKKNYTNYSTWPVKIALLISIFLFMAMLTKRSYTEAYYTLNLVSSDGSNPYLHGGTILWYLHMVNLAYLGLIALVSLDSIRMMGWFAPVRIIQVTFSIFISAVTSQISFFMLVIMSFMYLAFKIIAFLFKNNRRVVIKEKKPSLVAKYYMQFLEVKNSFDSPDIDNSSVRVRKPKPKPKTRLDFYDDNIPKLKSDS